MMPAQAVDSQSEPSRVNQPVFKLLSVILLATLATQLAHLAYNSEHDFQSIVLPSVLYLSATVIPLGGLGIWFGRQIGLGVPLLAALLQNQPGAWRNLLRDAKISMLLGLMIGAGLVLLRMATESYLPSEIPTFGHRGVWGGIIVSAAAALSEEIWFRLGIMTMLLWSFARLLGYKTIPAALAWPVVIFVSVAFGMAHLPQLMSHGAGTSFAIWATILGNSLVGTFYGWCYWRLSFIAAVLAHFAVDLVIHAVPAVFV